MGAAQGIAKAAGVPANPLEWTDEDKVKITEAFWAKYDGDGSGGVDATELGSMCVALNNDAKVFETKEEVNVFAELQMKKEDVDGDAQLSEEEFAALMSNRILPVFVTLADEEAPGGDEIKAEVEDEIAAREAAAEEAAEAKAAEAEAAAEAAAAEAEAAAEAKAAEAEAAAEAKAAEEAAAAEAKAAAEEAAAEAAAAAAEAAAAAALAKKQAKLEAVLEQIVQSEAPSAETPFALLELDAAALQEALDACTEAECTGDVVDDAQTRSKLIHEAIQERTAERERLEEESEELLAEEIPDFQNFDLDGDSATKQEVVEALQRVKHLLEQGAEYELESVMLKDLTARKVAIQRELGEANTYDSWKHTFTCGMAGAA